MKSALFALALLTAANTVLASDNYTFPKTIDKNATYVFCSHGYIVEGNNPTPVHGKWGTYDFPAIKKALSDTSYQLIATHRPAKTDPFQFAETLASQVSHLMEGGVPAKNISLVGFSRGGFITAIASSYLKNKDINLVILAACISGLAKRQAVTLHGHLLSIYETSDSVGPCDDIVRGAETPWPPIKSWQYQQEKNMVPFTHL